MSKGKGPWNLALGYDYRFGHLGIRMSREGEEPVDFLLPLSELFKQCRIHPEELRAYMRDSLDDKAVVPGQDIEPVRYKTLEDTDWKGKIVLDVGGYDGFAAEIAHKGGARRAICLDNHQYEHYGWEDIKKPGVEYITGDLMEWNEPVDVLINYNLVYHLRNPWLALDHCRAITREQMLLCTLFRYSDRPNWYLYEPYECNPTDRTVYWGPSIMGLERLLKATGWNFTQEGIAMDRVVYRCTPVPGFKSDLANEGYAKW